MKKHSHFGPKCGPCGASLRPAVAGLNFRAGEVYLFHRSDSRCPGSSSLWGQYDKHYRGRLYLESSSHNLRTFRHWHIYRKSIAIADVPAGKNYATIYRD